MWAAAIADHRALVSENVRDFRRLEADALAAAHSRALQRLSADIAAAIRAQAVKSQ